MGTLARGLLLVLVVAGAVWAGARWGPDLVPGMASLLDGDEPSGVESEGPEPTPELAEATLDRFERFRAGDAGERFAVGGAELTAVVRHSLPGLLPAGVSEPTVRLADGSVGVSARVAVGAFPRLPALGEVVGFLPDTLLMEMGGSLEPLDRNHLALVVDRVRAARVPLPRRMYGEVLRGLRGERGPPALPAHALPVPRPDGLRSVFVQGDSLVLLAPAPGGR